MSMKMPSINSAVAGMKQMTSDATTMFSRALQFTEEKLGSAEKTEYDENFEKLLDSYELTRKWTEKLKTHTEMALQPNPNTRLEDKVYLKLDKKPPQRQTNIELLGIAMADAGNEFGPVSSFGSILMKCGEAELHVSDAEQEFFQSTVKSLLHPFCSFLDGDCRTIQRELKLLENKRLDLDALKNKHKKAKTKEAQKDIEAELGGAQTEFERQKDIVRLQLEGISGIQAQQTRGLIRFISAQAEYYQKCYKQLQDLKSHLKTLEPTMGCFDKPGSSNSQVPVNDIIKSPRTKPLKARVLYDYDAADPSELSLLADEIVTIQGVVDPNKDYVMAKRGETVGKVLLNYITMID